jgi:hypothetical protein
MCSRWGIIRSVTQHRDVNNFFDDVLNSRLHCRQLRRIPEGTYDNQLDPVEILYTSKTENDIKNINVHQDGNAHRLLTGISCCCRPC